MASGPERKQDGSGEPRPAGRGIPPPASAALQAAEPDLLVACCVNTPPPPRAFAPPPPTRACGAKEQLFPEARRRLTVSLGWSPCRIPGRGDGGATHRRLGVTPPCRAGGPRAGARAGSTRAGGPGSFCDGGVAQGARPGATWGGPRAGPPFPRTRGGRIGRPRCAVTRRGGGGGVAIFTRTRVCASGVCARRMRAAGSACVHSRSFTTPALARPAARVASLPHAGL